MVAEPTESPAPGSGQAGATDGELFRVVSREELRGAPGRGERARSRLSDRQPLAGRLDQWMIAVLPRLVRAEERFPDVQVLLLRRCFRQHVYMSGRSRVPGARANRAGLRTGQGPRRASGVGSKTCGLLELVPECARRVTRVLLQP